NANKSPKVASSHHRDTAEELSESLGIDRHLFFDAKKVHEIFAKDPDYQALMEPRILSEPIGGEHEEKRPVGLGAVIAGWKGRNNKGKAREDHSQLELFSDCVATLFNRFTKLLSFDALDKSRLTEEVKPLIADMKPGHREALADYLAILA